MCTDPLQSVQNLLCTFKVLCKTFDFKQLEDPPIAAFSHYALMPRAYRASSAFDWLVAKITEPWSKESKASSLTGQTHCLAEVGLACETKKGLGQTI